eukprot:420355-Rhodomonas_salina.6
MSGTDIPYGAICCYAIFGTDFGYGAMRYTVLTQRMVLPGTTITTVPSSHSLPGGTLSAYARATPCLVLT